tara:strand:- start:5008 stop:6540 length:1533 start_codon:yes stop_codon:yes gene_type:complete
MKLEASHIPEPQLNFGLSQALAHPKDGLFLFGPTEPRMAREIRIGAIGSKVGIERLARWMKRVQGFIPAFNERAHHSPFPGFQAAFDVQWPMQPQTSIEIDEAELLKRIRYEDPYHAIYQAVELFVSELQSFKRRSDTRPDLWIVVLPEEVSKWGRPKSNVPKELRVPTPGAIGKRAADRERDVPVLFQQMETERLPYQYERNFHNQLKARLLEDEIVTQIVRETTLAPEDFVDDAGRSVRALQDPATTAWNLATTIYYKTAGPPWKLANVRPDVCYIGLAYKVDPNRPAKERVCCGAQMFLASGEGVVFRGHLGPWESASEGEHHLDRATAQTIISEVIESYKTEKGHPPREVFIHGKTQFRDEEWSGFEAAAMDVETLCAVQIQKSKNLKLFRDKTESTNGAVNLLRGTAVVLDDRNAFLWTTGYIPRLETYPGWEVPNPYYVSIQRGEADIETVLKDVLGLTKLNFNGCMFADGQPVTLRFADAIGEILTAGHNFTKLKPLPFKFYI